MATLVNIRIHTQSKAVPNADYIAIDKVMMEGNTIVAEGGNVRYVLGVVPMENIVVETPSNSTESGCNTTNANIFATLIKGVDGVTPDMSDYYNKGQVDEKLSTKQDVVRDIETIRDGANKGATALQRSNVDGELSPVSRNPVQNAVVTKEVSQIGETMGMMYGMIGGIEEEVANKQDAITDLDTIRSGASKGATAVQPNDIKDFVTEGDLADVALTGSYNDLNDTPTFKTINGEPIVGEGNIEIEGGTADLEGYATEEYVDNAVEAVNVKGEDGYVYSNGEKVDMRFTRSLLPVGTSIPKNANLNTKTYLKVGKYYCSLNVDAQTITNCPIAEAFSMEVFNPLGTNVDDEDTREYTYRIRRLTHYKTGIEYIQYCNTSGTAGSWTYGNWYASPLAKATLQSDKNGSSLALGSSAKGIYIKSDGTLATMTYEVGKSVPSNAVFTDTKVTAVGNHYTPVENASVAIAAGDGEVVVGLKRDAAGHIVGVETTSMTDYVDNAIKTAITETLTTEV